MFKQKNASKLCLLKQKSYSSYTYHDNGINKVKMAFKMSDSQCILFLN